MNAPAPRVEPRAPESPPTWAPRYVHACHDGAWLLQLRSKSGRRGVRTTYKCGSRHHRGPCRDRWRRMLFSRIRDGALAEADHRAVSFWTMTLPASWHRRPTSRKRLMGHVMLGRLWTVFRKGLNRWLARRDEPPVQYLWVREVHRSGVAHLHAVIVHRGIADRLRARDAMLADDGASNDALQPPPPAMLELASGAGWGRVDASCARSTDALAGYMSKIVGESEERHAGRVPGELAKPSQTPERLPRHCRSYGASRGFIAPRRKDPDWVGWIEDGAGRMLGRRAEVADRDLAVPLRPLEDLPRAVEGPVWDPQNELARWDDPREAQAYAAAQIGVTARVYRIGPSG